MQRVAMSVDQISIEEPMARTKRRGEAKLRPFFLFRCLYLYFLITMAVFLLHIEYKATDPRRIIIVIIPQSLRVGTGP